MFFLFYFLSDHSFSVSTGPLLSGDTYMEAFTTCLPSSPFSSPMTISPITMISTPDSSELIQSFNQQALFWAQRCNNEQGKQGLYFQETYILSQRLHLPLQIHSPPFCILPVTKMLTSKSPSPGLPCPLKVQ